MHIHTFKVEISRRHEKSPFNLLNFIKMWNEKNAEIGNKTANINVKNINP